MWDGRCCCHLQKISPAVLVKMCHLWVPPIIMKGHAHQPNPAKMWLGIGLMTQYSWMGLNRISQLTNPETTHLLQYLMHGRDCQPHITTTTVSGQSGRHNSPVTLCTCTFQPLHMLFPLLEHPSSGKLRMRSRDSLDAIPPLSSFLVLRAALKSCASPTKP